MKTKLIIIFLLTTFMTGANPTEYNDTVRVKNIVKNKTNQVVKMEITVDNGTKDSYKDNIESHMYNFTRYNKYNETEYYTGYKFEYVHYIIIDKNNSNNAALLIWSNEQEFYFSSNFDINIEVDESFYLCTFNENGVDVKIKIYRV